MKKSIRILAMLLIVVLVFSTMMSAHAQSVDQEDTRANKAVTCGLTLNSGSSYRLWGKVTYGSNANLTIVVKLYSNNGSTLVTTCSQSETGIMAYAEQTVNLTSGVYIVRATGYVNGVLIGERNKTISIP
jgi:spore coat protein U-like protein